MSILWLDFETRSRCDLTTKGVYNYAQDASTDVLCMSYAFDDDDVVTWTPDQPFPEAVRHHTGRIYAHNAAFERLIFWYVLQCDFQLEQFYCTAAQARANCLPGSLEDVGRAISSNMRKDHRGSQLIRLLSIPRADGSFNDSPELMAEMIRYCEQDVRAMRAVSQAMRPLSDQELADYHVNERINDRGVLLDLPLAKAAIDYASVELEEIETLVADLTKGEITSVRSPKMRQWVIDRVGPQALKMMEVYKDGEKKYSIDKSVRANLLVFAEENHEEIPAHVADVIQCADDLWASSVAKFSRLAGLADEDDHRVRGAFVFAGGSATGRASSYGAQVHNMSRKCAEDPEAVRHAMVRGHSITPRFGKRVTDVLKGMLRPALIAAPGKQFVVADWSAVEARVTAWASADPQAEEVLQVFRDGRDIYKREAAGIYRVPEDAVDKEQRQIGKVAILSCFSPQTQVLTDVGVKAIVDVQLTDKLWDGTQWVSHQGVVKQGVKEVINVCGMWLTEGHQLLAAEKWYAAKTVHLDANIRSQMLATGSANLPLLGLNALNTVSALPQWLGFNVRVAQNRIWSRITTFEKVGLRGAICALKNNLVSGVKIITDTLTLFLMMRIAAGCSVEYPRVSTVATTQKTAGTSITANAAFTFMKIGEKTDARSLVTLSPWMAGIRRLLSWIGSTSTKAMSRAIFGLFRAKKTCSTSDPFLKCSGTSSNWSPVYDILNAGPKNRFTVVTAEGPVIAHNCGFGGGIGAFAAMGRNYNVIMTEADAKRTVDAWRRANAWAVRYWGKLEEAYTRALRNPGREFSAGRVTYLYDKQHLWYALPSGRILCYPFAKFEGDEITYVKAAWKPAADAKEWPRARLWRGLACENITQAVANDLLRHALRQLDDVVLHVHDEIVLETSDPDAPNTLKQVMCTPPEWAVGLPLNAEVETMTRYGKG